MRWKDKLSDNDLEHLKVMCIETLKQFKEVRAAQIHANNEIDKCYVSNWPHESCYECAEIQEKLGLKLDEEKTGIHHTITWFV